MGILTQPNDIDAERQVLGACLMNKEAAETAMQILEPADFYLAGNGDIFEAIVNSLAKNITPDLVSITDYLRSKGQLEKIGGVTYIASLTGQVASTAFIKQHAKIVESKSVARKVLSAVERVKAKAYSGEINSPGELTAYAEAELSGIQIKTSHGGLEHVGQGLTGVIKDIENRKDSKSISGIPTGYPLLTAWLAGYQKGDLIIIAGRPSMGKTTFALQEAKDAAVKYGVKVAFFSLEMSRRQLIEKLLINQGMVSAQNVRTGMLNAYEWQKITQASAKLLDSGVYIDDSSKLTTIDIAQRCRRMQSKVGLDMVVIDYLGLVKPAKRSEKRYLEIGEITKDLKILAKELDIPVILLSQLSRDCESRQEKRPQLSDLRESGEIEQDADVVMFIYRDSMYNKQASENSAEIILAKQRNGPTGKFELVFIKEYTKFALLESKHKEVSQ